MGKKNENNVVGDDGLSRIRINLQKESPQKKLKRLS